MEFLSVSDFDLFFRRKGLLLAANTESLCCFIRLNISILLCEEANMYSSINVLDDLTAPIEGVFLEGNDFKENVLACEDV